LYVLFMYILFTSATAVMSHNMFESDC
jgi:hypothetical protein